MFGLVKHLIRTDVTRLIQNLIARKYLSEDTVFSRNNIYAASCYIRLGERASDILMLGQVFMFSISKKKKSVKGANTKKKTIRKVSSIISDDLEDPNGRLEENIDDDYVGENDFYDEPSYDDAELNEDNSGSSSSISRGKYRRGSYRKPRSSGLSKRKPYSDGTNRRVSTYFKKTYKSPKANTAFRKPKTVSVNKYRDSDGYITIPD